MLIILRGTSNSFKSTFARRYFSFDSIISIDMIRKKLFGTCNYFKEEELIDDICSKIINSRLKHGLIAIVDSTNLYYRFIKKFINIAIKNNSDYVIFSFTRDIDDTIAGSIDRQRSTGGPGINKVDIISQSESYLKQKKIIIDKCSQYFYEFVVRDEESLSDIYKEYEQIVEIRKNNEAISRPNKESYA